MTKFIEQDNKSFDYTKKDLYIKYKKYLKNNLYVRQDKKKRF